MLVSIVLENLFFKAIFSIYRADRTPSGKDTMNAINIAQNEPIIAPLIPANSGSLLSAEWSKY